MTMTWIAGQTLSSNATLSFNSIPSTFTHLQLRCFFKSASAISSSGAGIRFNSDSTSIYPRHTFQGNGSAVEGGANISGNTFAAIDAAADTFNQWGVSIVDILDYTNTNKNKVVRTLFGMDNNGSGGVGFISSYWPSTVAINSVTIIGNNASNLLAGSRFDLYGITTSAVTGA